MSDPKERKDEDEITIAKSIFDEIVEETERDEECDEPERRQINSDVADGKAVAVK